MTGEQGTQPLTDALLKERDSIGKEVADLQAKCDEDMVEERDIESRIEQRRGQISADTDAKYAAMTTHDHHHELANK